jgi:hypothetical protein
MIVRLMDKKAVDDAVKIIKMMRAEAILDR